MVVREPQLPDRMEDSFERSAESMLIRQRYFTWTHLMAYAQCAAVRGGSHTAGSRSPLDAFTLSVTAIRLTCTPRSLANRVRSVADQRRAPDS